jgi:hypothetical protein
MELGAMYERAVSRSVAASVYAAAVGEPALGPVAYMHRHSAENDPLAPIGHHWQDAAHESFGVVTAGVYSRRVKLEGSAFNAREPDEYRFNLDYQGARLDSYAGRVSWAATPGVTAAAWYGYLSAHERLSPENKMHRYGASVVTEAAGIGGGKWASTFMWAMNLHHHEGVNHALAHGDPNASPHHHAASLLAETNLEIGTRHAVFARLERVAKNGEELGFLGGDLTETYDVRSVVIGGLREIGTWGRGALGFGARGAVTFVPAILEATYGTRTPSGFALYVQVRPRRIGN